jgi:hypothetical protein
VRRRRTVAASSTAPSSSPRVRRSQTVISGGSPKQVSSSGISLADSQTRYTSDNSASGMGPSSPTAEQISSSLLFTPGAVILGDTPTAWASDDQRPCESPTSPGILSRSTVFGDYPGVDCSTAHTVESGSELSKIQMSVLRLYGAFELPSAPVRRSLCEAFFERCWTWMPVVDFDVLQESPSRPPSILIQQAMLLAGSQMRKGTTEYTSREDFYQRTKALLDIGFEKDVLLTLATLCMVQWWNPAAPTDISTNTSRFWVTYGIGLAQQLGLHRKAERPVEREGLRRRIWWTLYVSCNNRIDHL